MDTYDRFCGPRSDEILMIQTYNVMQSNDDNKRSSEDVRWRSFHRWGTVKVKVLETNAPDDQI